MSLLDMGIYKDKHCILDTDDLVTEYIDEVTLSSIKNKNIVIKKANTMNLGISISSKDNNYSLFINGNLSPIYTGSFQNYCSRNDLFGFDIKISELGFHKNNIYIAIIANVWCKYDIEVPMVLCQVLYTPIKDIRSMNIACKTKEPIYISSKSTLKQQYKQCFGDFPNKALEGKYCNIVIDNKKFKIFGVDYTNTTPIYEVLDDKLPYNHI